MENWFPNTIRKRFALRSNIRSPIPNSREDSATAAGRLPEKNSRSKQVAVLCARFSKNCRAGSLTPPETGLTRRGLRPALQNRPLTLLLP